MGAKRGKERETAAAALRLLGGRWISTSVAGPGDITLLEMQANAARAAADANMWLAHPRNPGAYLSRIETRITELRKLKAEDDTPLLVPEKGTYETDGIEYAARPIDVAELYSPRGPRTFSRDDECLYSGSSYTCGCAPCIEYRLKAMWLTAAVRNRAQPSHPKLLAGTRADRPLIALPPDDYDDILKLRTFENMMRDNGR